MQVQVHTQGRDASLGSGSPPALDSALVSELSGSAELRSALRRQTNRQGKKALKWKWWHTAVITALGRPRVQAQPQISAFSGSVCLIFLSLSLGTGFLVSVCFLISRSTIFLSYCLSLKFLLGRVHILLLIITVVCDVGCSCHGTEEHIGSWFSSMQVMWVGLRLLPLPTEPSSHWPSHLNQFWNISVHLLLSLGLVVFNMTFFALWLLQTFLL